MLISRSATKTQLKKICVEIVSGLGLFRGYGKEKVEQGYDVNDDGLNIWRPSSVRNSYQQPAEGLKRCCFAI
jgi:hypothetical protein